MGFLDFFLQLNNTEKILTIGFICLQILPFIFAGIYLKKRVKVGKVDIYQFMVLLATLGGISYFILDFFVDAMNILANIAPTFVGIFLMFYIFNKTSEGVRKTFIVEFDLANFNVNINYCYCYSHGGYQCLIELDENGLESLGNLLKRILGHHKYLICEGARFEFTEHLVNLAYLCTRWEKIKATIPIDGKDREADVIYVTPIPTTEFNELEFLINFKSFKKLTEKISQLYTEKIRMEADIYVLAIDLFKNWAKITEEATFGTQKPTLSQILERYAKPKEDEQKKAQRKVVRGMPLKQTPLEPETNESEEANDEGTSGIRQVGEPTL